MNYAEDCGHGGVSGLTVAQPISEEPQSHELIHIRGGALDILSVKFGVDGQLVSVDPVDVGIECFGVDVLQLDDATGGLFPDSTASSFEVV